MYERQHDHVLQIIRSAIDAADAAAAVRRHVNVSDSRLIIETTNNRHTFSLDDFKSILVVGAGKAVVRRMAAIPSAHTSFIGWPPGVHGNGVR